MDLPRRLEDYPADIRLFLTDLYQRAVAQLSAVVARHGTQPGLSLALAEARIGFLDSEMQPVIAAMAKAATPVACARGCGACCTLTIEASPDEVFALTAYLARTLPPADLAAFSVRARAADARGHGLAPLDRHRLRIPCPVLDPATGECLGHAARPNGCQGYFSLNLAQCQADHANPPQPISQPVAAALLRDVVAAARDAVLIEAGAPRQSLELTAALVAAAAETDAETRWLAGETVFESASSRDNPLKSSYDVR
jgi:Fe-S-cluster containining protein